MKPGVYRDITNAAYHGGVGASKSFLDVVDRSALHAKALLDQANDNDAEPTPAQVIGTAFHTLLLEPELFRQQYVRELTKADAPDAIEDREVLVKMVEEINADRLPKLATGGSKEEQIARIIAAWAEQGQPAMYSPETLQAEPAKQLKLELERLNESRAGKLSTSGNRHELAALLAEHGKHVRLWSDVKSDWGRDNAGRIALNAEQVEQLVGMRDAVMAHPAASALLKGCEGVAEASVYATDPTTGELRRVRPDFWRKDGVIVDVKTAEDASPEGFAKSVANYRYHVQDPYYLDTLQLAHDAGHFPQGWAAPKAFVFLTVEKKAPYAVACYVLDGESREIGRQQYRGNLDTFAECKRSGKWPGYGDTLQQIGVPQWYLNRNLHLIGAA